MKYDNALQLNKINLSTHKRKPETLKVPIDVRTMVGLQCYNMTQHSVQSFQTSLCIEQNSKGLCAGNQQAYIHFQGIHKRNVQHNIVIMSELCYSPIITFSQPVLVSFSAAAMSVGFVPL